MTSATAVATHESALRFWLRFATREGALVEDAGDHAVLVLPQELQEAAELPEEVAVTSDPDVAREDGAVLLIAGHPELERAAAAVLEAGDIGRAYLPWPASAPPRIEELERAARDRWTVEHGRIDCRGQPRPVFAPLLRIGAIVHYEASLTHQFHEQVESWVDARTGLPPPQRALNTLLGQHRPEAGPDVRHRTLPARLELALAAGHADIERRAEARAARLLEHGRRAHDAELARADEYYRGTLESLERRRVAAPPERARLLEDQAAATRGERDRRRREIEQQYRPRHELRPFRLHLVMAPAYAIAADVRRGARRYPLELVWLAGGAGFADLLCPRCDGDGELVAGREQLGCHTCLPRATAATEGGARGVVAEGPRSGSATPRQQRQQPTPPSPSDLPGFPNGDRRGAPRPTVVEDGARPSAAAAAGTAVVSPARRPPERPPPSARRRLAAERDSRGSSRGDGLEERGNKLALELWQRVALGERLPRSKIVRDSPLSALHRLYGAAGPLRAIGVAPGNCPSEATASTFPGQPLGPQVTGGEIVAGGRKYRYLLCWWLVAGKPVVAELTATIDDLLRLRRRQSGTTALAGERPPAPVIALDSVAAELWRIEPRRVGLTIAARCLATWWRVATAIGEPADPSVLAAAIGLAVSRASGLRRTRADGAAVYGVAPSGLDAAARTLRPLLGLDPGRGW
ncbi:MAG: hypothetical protein ACR2KV_00915 [Solirubrobacteraceae bacterium]